MGRYIRNLIKELQLIDKKNEYVLFVLSDNQDGILKQIRQAHCGQVQDDNYDNFRIVRADIRWHSIEEQIKFPAILNKENLDLVHFPYFSVPIFYNKPFVVTIHDLILHHFPTGEASTLPSPIYQLKLLGYKYVISQAAKKAKKIITVSNATKQEIVDHLSVPAEKIAVTHESVDDRLSSKLPTSPRSAGLRGASEIKNYFLYVGNAYPHKNLERLLQAFKIITQRAEVAPPRRGSPRLSLVFVGKEDYFYKRLKEKVKEMGLSGSIIFYGEASDEKLINLYQNAKALIMPSLMEGFGLPALEAMANKCLVLCSNIPALKEICSDAAVYFSPYDIDGIIEVIKNVCFNDSNHFSKNVEKGFERSKMFSWKKMAGETLNVYKEAL